MADPDNTPGLTRIGKRWKVQAYLSDEAAQAIADQAEACDQSVGSIVSAIIDKVAAGRNPTPTDKIIAAMKGAAQARKRG
tara:strand:- start:383 stop:622 length:240 start_codon:yes stop_codon:yes gene_type:complete